MSDAFIAKFLNSEIVKRGGDAVPLNEQGYRTKIIPMRIGGRGGNFVPRSTLVVMGKGQLNALGSTEFAPNLINTKIITVIADGETYLNATVSHSSITTAATRRISMLASSISHYTVTAPTTGNNFNENRIPIIPIAFNRSLEIVIEQESAMETPIGNNLGVTWTANLWVQDGAEVVAESQPRNARVLFFNGSGTAGTSFSFVMEDEVLNNEATIYAVSTGGNGLAAAAPVWDNDLWAQRQFWGQNGAAGNMLRAHRIPLKRGDTVNIHAGGTSTAVASRQTRITAGDLPEIILAPGANGTANNLTVNPTQPPLLTPQHVFAGHGRGGWGGQPGDLTSQRNARAVPGTGRVVITYSVVPEGGI